ncbi:hypothetical protein Pst134EA_026697 [Puccinia striiformis f. sp. tritici]|uniref:hypothetical protein n=1 Tax=Puccinia striiformis f. sp. tritici TaxID=168172 RepID=UPI002008985C|nr:hypothetical protein Pst134EA_026697 [Puccinia striiformis f. sp. tritici]KAH9449985.1 hypothetical protein Pst134EA_026697 [Puccinia striiformis f. sp. tritici]
MSSPRTQEEQEEVIKRSREEQEKSEKEPRKRQKTDGTQKKKKLKGLSKKDKEETQKIIASCERQKSSRLTAACRAPLTRLEDIVKKASTATAERPSYSRSNSGTHTFNPLTTKLTEKNGKKQDQISQPPTSPIKDFSSDDEHDDQLPSLDQINTHQPINNEKQKKKEWLAKLKGKPRDENTVTTTTHDNQQVIHMSESDSELDIIDQPTLTKTNQTFDPLHQRLSRAQTDPTKSNTNQGNHNSKRSSTTVSKSSNLMTDLLSRSAVDSAIIRRKKETTFVGKGGRLSTHQLTTTNNNDPSDAERVNLKNILQNHNSENKDDDENDVDYEWDELGSVDEVEDSEVDEDEEDEEEEEDGEEAEDLAKKTRIKITDDDDEDDEVENREGLKGDEILMDMEKEETQRKTNDDLKLPSMLGRSSICSSSSAFSTSKAPPARQSEGLNNSKVILAPDSTSTDHDQSLSSRDCSKHPLSPEPGDSIVLQPESNTSSPTDLLPGFNFQSPSQSPSKKKSMRNLDSPPLTGFGNLDCSSSSSEMMIDQSAIPGFTATLQKPMTIDHKVDNNQSGFSQFFGEDEGETTFTHPPPLLKPNGDHGHQKANITKSIVDDEDMNEINATCVLPAVNILPEEKERDMLMMVMGDQVNNTVDEDDQPTQYVNHRGLLTQNKPNGGPPDSPLMSQDVIARTPFALRREVMNSAGGVGRFSREMEMSPTKNSGIGSSSSRVEAGKISGWKVIRSPSPELPPLLSTTIPTNAFTKVMDAQKEQANISDTFKPPPPPPFDKKGKGKQTGAGKVFLADEADESEDEYEGIRRTRQEDERSSGSESEGSILKDLVNDDESETEKDPTKLKEEQLAREELWNLHQKEKESKHNEFVQKIVDGKIRIKQARGNRKDAGGISDSDSEDDLEIEIVKANKRAQEFASKKQKRAIHLLADKHAPFFKSYEEGTNHAVDEDDLAYLQPQEEIRKTGDDDDDDDEDSYGQEEEEEQEDEDEEDDDDVLLEDIFAERPQKSKKSRPKVGSDQQVLGAEGDSEEEEEGNQNGKERVGVYSSSPIHTSSTLPFKITTTTTATNKNRRSTKDGTSLAPGNPTRDQHSDLDNLYDNLQANKVGLSERQRKVLVNELGLDGTGSNSSIGVGGKTTGDNMRNRNGSSSRTSTSMASSVTFHNQKNQNLKSKIRDLDKIDPSTSTSTPTSASTSGIRKLAKLKLPKKVG